MAAPPPAAAPADAWSLFDEDESAAPGPSILNPLREVPADGVDVGPVATPPPEPLKLRLGAQVPLHYTLRPLAAFFMEHSKHTLDDLATLAEGGSGGGAAAGGGGGASAGVGGARRRRSVDRDDEGAALDAGCAASTPHGRRDAASDGAAALLDALRAASEAVTQLDDARRRAGKAAGKRGPAAAAATAAAAESEAAALDQLHGAGDALVETAWGWMRAHRAWPHVAWREAYVHGQLGRAVALSAGGDPLGGMHALDLALIMGAPAGELEGLVSALEMGCTVVKAANAAAEGAGKAAGSPAAGGEGGAGPARGAGAGGAPHPPAATLPVIPAVLGPDAELDLPPSLSPDHAVLRVAAMATGPAPRKQQPQGAAAGGGAPDAAPVSEHPRLTELRAPHEDGRPLSLPEFRRRFVKGSQPVVLVGATRNWRALEAWRDLDALCAAHGHRTVPIEVGQHLSGYWREEAVLLRDFVGSYIAPSLGWGWGKRVRVAAVDGPAPAVGLGAAGAAGPADGGAPGAGGGGGGVVVHPSAVAYLAQHGLFDQLPALTKDMDVPLYCGNEVGAVNAWFGTAGTVTRAHYDDYENVYVQVVGYKFVRLYAPADSDKMYRVVSATGAANPGRAGGDKAPAPAAAGGAGGGGKGGGKGSAGGGKGGGKGKPAAPTAAAPDATLAQGNVSAVDVEHPDLAAHPAFAGAHHYDAVLGPGDCLYIPKGWWHYLRALTTSWSVNFWF